MNLIGIDLDGTLLNSEQKISHKNAASLKSLSSDCFPFICSGREVGDIQAILKEADLAIPAVGLNGAIGYDQDKLIFDFPFDPQAVKEVSQIVSAFPTKIYTNQGSYESQNYQEEMKNIFYAIGQEFPVEELNYELDYENTIQSTAYDAIEEIINQKNINVYKLFVFVPNREIKKELFPQIENIPNVSVTESAAVNLEIVPRSVSKGFVFDHLSRIYELDQPTKFAIGDSLNDLEMFKNADISFAMANGHPAIKELADHVTVSNDEDDVSQALAMIKGTR